MKGDLHVRFCENTEVKFFCVTRLTASIKYTNSELKFFINLNLFFSLLFSETSIYFKRCFQQYSFKC